MKNMSNSELSRRRLVPSKRPRKVEAAECPAEPEQQAEVADNDLASNDEGSESEPGENYDEISEAN